MLRFYRGSARWCASSAEPVIRAMPPELAVFAAPHPNPTIVCTHPSVSGRVVAVLRQTAKASQSDLDVHG